MAVDSESAELYARNCAENITESLTEMIMALFSSKTGGYGDGAVDYS